MATRNNMVINKTSQSKVSDKSNKISGKIDNFFKSNKTLTELEKETSRIEKASHDLRIEDLREVADKLKEDSWKYPPVEKLLGLQN